VISILIAALGKFSQALIIAGFVGCLVILGASDFKLGTAARNAAADGIVDLIDGGAGAGLIDIRSGAPPATPQTASSGTLGGTLTCSDPAFGNAAAGVATASAITSDTDADASITAGYFRVFDSDKTDTACIMEGTAGEAADSTDMTFDNKTIVAGGTIAISAFTLTVPEA